MGKRSTPSTLEEQRKIARSLYEKQGASIRSIASLMGISYGKAHGLVVESGAAMRSRGGANRTKGK